MTAREEAERVPDDGPVRWRALEIGAFSAHPAVLRALDPRGRHHRPRAGLGTAGLWVAALLLLALIVAPVVAFVIALVDGFSQPPGPEWSIPTAAIVMLCTLPLLVVVFVAWYRSDRARDYLRELQISILAGFGLATFVVVLVRSGAQDYPDGVRWSAGIAVPSLFAAVFWIALLRDAWRLQRHAPAAAPAVPGSGERVTAVEPLRHVRLAVERLPERDRSAVRADLTAAIDDLEHRGVIDPPTAERARGAELGKLALRMAQGSRPR